MSIKKILRPLGFLTLAGVPFVLANVPRNSEITRDTAIYQNLHEINVKKVKNINFDGDINRLSSEEKAHHETLPVRVASPMNRVMKTPYKPASQRRL